jgi:hypothetical protein
VLSDTSYTWSGVLVDMIRWDSCWAWRYYLTMPTPGISHSNTVYLHIALRRAMPPSDFTQLCHFPYLSAAHVVEHAALDCFLGD